jgi:hypothetical protein
MNGKSYPVGAPRDFLVEILAVVGAGYLPAPTLLLGLLKLGDAAPHDSGIAENKLERLPTTTL